MYVLLYNIRRIDISIKVNYISNSKHISQRRSQQSIRIKTRATEINANRLLPQSVSIERGWGRRGPVGGGASATRVRHLLKAADAIELLVVT